ncbi:fatty acid desaturase [beta proteobacterium AAP99]|nr:fatty acid desaturase [beta proteobacterium AAP99]
MSQHTTPPQGEEFRNDERPAVAGSVAAGSSASAAAPRKLLSADELKAFTALSSAQGGLAVLRVFGPVIAVTALAVATQHWAAVVLAILVNGVQQHAMFVLAHEATHYRLFEHRGLNDFFGRLAGVLGGISMCTYRVTHRLHHNNLYGPEDPDTAIHGGYPRGRAYLWKKLAQDLAGLNAWKTFAYFFGSPALNADTGRSIRPLDDTSPALRAAARKDRWLVVAGQLLLPALAGLIWGGQGLALYLLLWVLPLVTVLQPILRLRAICEHGAVTDLSWPLTAARTNELRGLPGLIARAVFFPLHVNYHLEHHLYPAVPHYRLPALHALLATRGHLHGAQVMPWPHTLRTVFAPRRPKAQAAQDDTLDHPRTA